MSEFCPFLSHRYLLYNDTRSLLLQCEDTARKAHINSKDPHTWHTNCCSLGCAIADNLNLKQVWHANPYTLVWEPDNRSSTLVMSNAKCLSQRGVLCWSNFILCKLYVYHPLMCFCVYMYLSPFLFVQIFLLPYCVFHIQIM